MAVENNVTFKTTKLPISLNNLIEIQDEVVLVCGKRKSVLYNTAVDDVNVSCLNITGTPLITDLNINESIAVRESSRSRDDKNLVPMKLSCARMFINGRNNTKGNSKYGTIVCICDGTDNEHTLLVMSSLSNVCFESTKVCAQGRISLSAVQCDFESLKKYHIDNSEDKLQKVDSKITCLYELFGSQLHEHDLEHNVSNVGSILVECSWDSFQFDIPEHKSVTNLMLQVVVGHENSPTFNLYQDLELLQTCLSEISDKSSAEVTLSLQSKEDDELYSGITDILHTVHSMPFIKDESLKPSNDWNFTDKLWNVLKYCGNTNTLQQCFKILFDTIENEQLKIQIVEDDKRTMVGHTISEIFSGRMLIPHLSSKQCLELLIDLCMQKLMKSYLNVIKSCDLKIADEYLNKWKNLCMPTNADLRRTICSLSITREMAKAQYLFHTHIIVNFLQMTENLNFYNQINILVLKSAIDKYLTKPMPDTYFNIKTKRFCDLTIPLSLKNQKSILCNSKVGVWKMKLTTRLQHCYSTTLYYYSKKPVFPSHVYNYQDDLNTTVKEERLYALRLETYGALGRY
ncbi:hypothetical protein FQR65_LT08491 [Abscondita terminalis]|nr:hypothetical protein FQR65_LT08491 [Abscondita terminalis]